MGNDKDDDLIDPDFKGSIFEAIGLTERLCPHCRSHLAEGGICLNGCMLPGYLYRKLINMPRPKPMGGGGEESTS